MGISNAASPYCRNSSRSRGSRGNTPKNIDKNGDLQVSEKRSSNPKISFINQSAIEDSFNRQRSDCSSKSGQSKSNKLSRTNSGSNNYLSPPNINKSNNASDLNLSINL